LQLVAASGDAQLVEESAASNALKLPVVTDEGEAPVALVGEGDETGKRTGADHAGFIDLCGRPHKLIYVDTGIMRTVSAGLSLPWWSLASATWSCVVRSA